MKTLTSGDKLQCHYIAASPSDYRNAPSAGGLNYVVVTKDGTSRNIAFGFLANIKNRFLELHQPGSTDFGSLPAYGAAAFNTTLRKMMVEQGTTNDGKQDAIRQAQKEIGETRGILNETVILATERGNQLSSIQEQTEHLAAHSSSFRYGATNLKRRMWWKNVKLMVLLVLVVVFLVYLFVGFGCGLPGKCSSIPSVHDDTNYTSLEQVCWPLSSYFRAMVLYGVPGS